MCSIGMKDLIIEGMRLTPKEHLDRETKSGLYLTKKIATIDRMRIASQANMIWLTPTTLKELYADIKAAMPEIVINSYEVDIG